MATVLIVIPGEDLTFAEVAEGWAPADCGTTEMRTMAVRVAAQRHAEAVAERCRDTTGAPWDEVQVMASHEISTWRSLHPRDVLLVGEGDLVDPWDQWLEAVHEEAWEDVDVELILAYVGILRYGSVGELARDLATECDLDDGSRLVAAASEYALRRWRGWTPDWDVLRGLLDDLEVVSRLMNAEMIAEVAGVDRSTVYQWRRRHATFPVPIVELGEVSVWRWDDVEPWLAIERRPGRPRKGTTRRTKMTEETVMLVIDTEIPDAVVEAAGDDETDRLREVFGELIAERLAEIEGPWDEIRVLHGAETPEVVASNRRLAGRPVRVLDWSAVEDQIGWSEAEALWLDTWVDALRRLGHDVA